MIIFFVGCILTVLGVLGYIFTGNKSGIVDYLSIIGFATGIVIFLLSITFIAVAHIGVDVEIAKKEIEYESLCNRLEIINSDYEDISKSDVIKDISNWNIYVAGIKYWTYNPYTNWFYSKKLADSLKYIEYNK